MSGSSVTATGRRAVLALGRFDVTSLEGGLTLTARRFDAATRARWVRVTSLALMALAPGALVALAPRAAEAALVLGPLLGLGAALAERAYTVHHGLYDTGPWSRVRRRLEVESARQGDPRHPPHAARLVLDGKVLDPDDPARLVVTRSVHLSWMDLLRERYHVSLVFRHRVLRIESFEDPEETLALARLLGEAIGIEAAPEVITEGHFEYTLAGVLVVLATLTSFLGPLSWACLADVAEESTRLAIAFAIAAASALGAQQVGRRFGAVRIVEVAEAAYGIEFGARPSRRVAWIGAALWGVCALVLTVVGCSAGPRLSLGNFTLGGDRLLFTDAGSYPLPVGLRYRGEHQEIVALDPRTGRPRWSCPIEGEVSHLDLQGPVALAFGEHGYPHQTIVVAFDPHTGERRWETGAVGALDGVFFKDGCVVVALGDYFTRTGYQAFDAITGMSCAAIAPIASPDPRTEPAVLMDYYVRAPALAAAQRAQAMPARDQKRKRLSLESAGVTYALDGTGERMAVSAVGGGVAWTTELPAGAAPGLPFAASDGLVLVAGCAVRYTGPGCRARLIGLDAATGRVRFMKRRPESQFGPTDVAITAGEAILASAGGLEGYDAVTGELSWTAR